MVSRQRGVACSVAVVVVLVCARRQTNGFYSERGQDQWVRHHLLWGQAPGFFVEFGARDGVAHSNSAYFERTLGWRGLCIEPLDSEFRALQANRPQCRCVHGAISTRRAVQDFVIVDGRLGWNGFWESMTPHRQRQLIKLNRSGEVRLRTIRTQTYELGQLLRGSLPTAAVPHVDLLSIDTEGNELSVLETLDFGAIIADVVQVERNADKLAIDRLMRRHGYRPRIDAQLQDSIYVRRGFTPRVKPWWVVRCLPYC
mmetsp:Transcript_42584/g.96259  ORF Transcript_42584/g.96259 Transcript_42584/m.96259 type:complete len:256 (-) Transcript_42584:325-1092(-)